MNELVRALGDFATGELLTLLLAVGILVGGWIVGEILARAVRAVLDRTPLDERIGGALAAEVAARLPLSRIAAEVVRWSIFAYALLLFADTLGLENATGPISSLLTAALGHLPRIAGALFVLALGFGLARIVHRAVPALFGATRLSKRLDEAGDPGDGETFGESLATTLHAVIVLFALLIALDLLRLEGVVDPLTGPASAFLGFLPRLLVVLAMLGGGYVLARVVSTAVTNVLGALGVDELARKVGFDRAGITNASGVCGTITFVLVLLPVVAAALDALGIEGVAGTSGSLVGALLGAVPDLLLATLVVAAGVVFGGILGRFAADLLARIGFDGILARLGLDRPDSAAPAARQPSRVAGALVRIAVIVVTAAEACRILGLGRLADAVIATCYRAGDWVLGIAIFGFGLWLAGFLADVVRRQRTPASGVLAVATRVSIGFLALIVALEEMGLARWTVEHGFVAALAGLGLAIGLAFGLGGGRHARDLVTSWRRGIDSGH